MTRFSATSNQAIGYGDSIREAIQNCKQHKWYKKDFVWGHSPFVVYLIHEVVTMDPKRTYIGHFNNTYQLLTTK